MATVDRIGFLSDRSAMYVNFQLLHSKIFAFLYLFSLDNGDKMTPKRRVLNLSVMFTTDTLNKNLISQLLKLLFM